MISQALAGWLSPVAAQICQVKLVQTINRLWNLLRQHHRINNSLSRKFQKPRRNMGCELDINVSMSPSWKNGASALFCTQTQTTTSAKCMRWSVYVREPTIQEPRKTPPLEVHLLKRTVCANEVEIKKLLSIYKKMKSINYVYTDM